MTLRTFRVAWALALSAGAWACSAENGSHSPGPEPPIPVLAAEPWEVTLSFSDLAPGDSDQAYVTITNTGTGDLHITSVTLNYQPPADAVEQTPSIRLIDDLPELPLTLPPLGIGDDRELRLSLLFTRPQDDRDRQAGLRIESNAYDLPTLTIPITFAAGTARLRVVPTTVDLGNVQVGHTKNVEALLRNSGSAEVVVSSFQFEATSPGYRLLLESDAYDPGYGLLVPVLRLAPGGVRSFALRYNPAEAKPSTANVVFFSNDPAAPDGTAMKVTAHQKVPCLDVFPAEIDFGFTSVGQGIERPVRLTNCSPSTPLKISGLSFEDGPGAPLDSFHLGGPPEILGLSAEAPLELAPGEFTDAGVIFAPQYPGSPGPAGPSPQHASLVIASNAATGTAVVPLSGVGLDPDCPVPVITIEEGTTVLALTVLHLHGEGSYSANGAITKYAWSVEPSAGDPSTLVPSPSYPAPTYQVNLSGTYVFSLDVWDETGRKSCVAAKVVVSVEFVAGLRVELTWTSPGDPNPNDEGRMAGTDLDLHVAHPNASQEDLDGDGKKDPWFDPTWDCFWFYPMQNWGSISSNDDNANLVRDDVDGLGPEIFELQVPEYGLTYAIGVNYWDDHGFGSSFATVRVFLDSMLVYEVTDKELFDHDMWWVADVTWPSGVVTPKKNFDGSRWIVHDYHHPLFYQP